MLQRTLRLFTVILTIGLLASCASTDPNIDAAKSDLKKQDFESALQAAEKAIQTKPNSGLGYYYKGVAYSEIAQSKDDIAARREYYKKMRDAFNKAEDLFNKAEDKPKEADNLDAVLLSVWSSEHNAAVKQATNDSLKQQGGLKKAEEHLKNAIVVQPDSTLSYDVLTEVYVMENNIPGAIESLSKSIQLSDSVAPQKYQRLALFYNNQKQPEKALDALKKGLDEYPDNVDLVQNLADTYLQMGESEKAIDVVRGLIEQDPDNPQYHLVLGTQLYQAVMRLSDSLSTNYDKIFDLHQSMKSADQSKSAELKSQATKFENINEDLQSQISTMTDEAVKELNKVIDLRPKDDGAYNTLGIIYQNKAAALYEKRNNTEDNEKAAQYNQQAQEELKQAMNYYEKAADLNPDKKEYWRNLFKVYTTLGMDAKAQDAMEKAGLNNN